MWREETKGRQAVAKGTLQLQKKDLDHSVETGFLGLDQVASSSVCLTVITKEPCAVQAAIIGMMVGDVWSLDCGSSTF